MRRRGWRSGSCCTSGLVSSCRRGFCCSCNKQAMQQLGIQGAHAHVPASCSCTGHGLRGSRNKGRRIDDGNFSKGTSQSLCRSCIVGRRPSSRLCATCSMPCRRRCCQRQCVWINRFRDGPCTIPRREWLRQWLERVAASVQQRGIKHGVGESKQAQTLRCDPAGQLLQRQARRTPRWVCKRAVPRDTEGTTDCKAPHAEQRRVARQRHSGRARRRKMTRGLAISCSTST